MQALRKVLKSRIKKNLSQLVALVFEFVDYCVRILLRQPWDAEETENIQCFSKHFQLSI